MGELPTDSMSMRARASFAWGCCTTLEKSRLTFSTMAGGVPDRTTMPFQLNASKPGTVSATVGMLGSKEVRLAVVTPATLVHRISDDWPRRRNVYSQIHVSSEQVRQRRCIASIRDVKPNRCPSKS